MQTLTIKIKDKKDVDFLIELLSKFAFVEEIKTAPRQIQSEEDYITSFRLPKGKPSIDDFKGLWQDNPKTLEQIREKAWKRTM